MTIYYDTEADPYIRISNYTLEDSTLSYFELCELMQNQETKTYWDQKAQTSFAIIKIKVFLFKRLFVFCCNQN